MTTFERRQRVLALLREQPGLRVSEMAKILDVSEGTIRNDLDALDQAGQLIRVRGGAILKDNQRSYDPAFEIRTGPNTAAKKRMARWAADMVADGDSILLDASTTVFHMIPFLQKHHNLTIFTNSLEVARALSSNPAHTTILIGGVLRPDGISVVGHLGERFLKDLHIKTAFISCSGFSIDIGLTELDIQEAPLKSSMVRCADRVVALIDSSKFGQTSLTPFATLDQLDHIISDSNITPQYIDQLRQTNTTLTICGETTASSFAPLKTEHTHYKIGFANLSEEIPFAVDVRHGLEQAAQAAGNIDLIVADNQLNGETAFKVAKRLIEKGVDLAIEFQIDEKMGSLIMNKFQQAGIPVIAIDIPMVGASFLGADNYQSGHMAGVGLGNWLQQHWQGQFDRLVVLEEPRAGALPAARIQGQLDGLETTIGKIPSSKITPLDSGNTSEISEEQFTKVLKEWPDVHQIAVISFNDDAAMGALQAARNAAREADVVIVGQGADRCLRPEIRRPNSRIIGSTAFMPEKYGEKVVGIALKILRGEPVPPAVYIDHTFINAENIDLYYPD